MCCSAVPFTTTRWRRPIGRLISMMSPGRISRWGLPDWPFTSTLPPLQAFCASDLVRNRHETSAVYPGGGEWFGAPWAAMARARGFQCKRVSLYFRRAQNPFVILWCLSAALGSAAFQATEPVDAAINAKIRDEGLTRSQAGAYFATLVDTFGARLTGSTAHKRSAEWARDTMTKIGLAGARLEPFEFGRGWELDKQTIEMIEPRYMPLIGYAEAWSPATPGDVIAPAVLTSGKSAEEARAVAAAPKRMFSQRQSRISSTDRAPTLCCGIAPGCLPGAPVGAARGGTARRQGRPAATGGADGKARLAHS